MTRYIPVPPGRRVLRALGATRRPGPVAALLAPLRRRRAVPSYATAAQCRSAHPDSEVWAIWIGEGEDA